MVALSIVAPAASPDEIARFLSESVGEAIHLVAITPDGPIAGRWFGDDAAAATAWAIDRNEAGANLYWTANRCRPGVHKKASKADIEGARFAHVDVDPPKGGGAWDKDAARAALLSERWCQPSFVIDSGGGFQAFWRLDEESANLPAVEALNVGLRDRFGGDNCQSIEHVMRLPGTVNYPDARKRARGRVVTAARMIEADDGVCHSPLAIARYFRPPDPVTPAPAKATAERSGPAALATADSLGLPARDPVRATIDHPPGRDRSSDALACAGAMARAGFTDAQIEGVLLNPDNAVSTHCLGQRNSVRAAWRCIDTVRADLAPAAPIETFPFADLTAWAGTTPMPKRFVMAGVIPEREVTLFTGPGGVNKSTFGLQLCACSAADVPMLGVGVAAGPSLYVTAEDDDPENHWRLAKIASAIGTSLDQLAGKLHVVSLRGRLNNELATFDAEGRLRPAVAYQMLRATIEATGSKLVVLDNVGHLYIGNENDRGQVTAFVNLLYQLCRELGVTVVLIGHPNKAGDSYSGSTAWLNAVRSQIVLQRPRTGTIPTPAC